MKETFKLVKDLKVLWKSSSYPQDYIKNLLKNEELVNQITVDTKLFKGKDKKMQEGLLYS